MSEILAPAGGEKSAIAAINSGCDAIYLGLDRFSARSSAENFDIGLFKKICEYAHAFGVKVYAALNTLVKDSELDEFLSSAIYAWNTGADALIIQDIFLGKYLKENFPQMHCLPHTANFPHRAYRAAISANNETPWTPIYRQTALLPRRKHRSRTVREATRYAAARLLFYPS